MVTHAAGGAGARSPSGLCLSSARQHERALGELQAALTLNPSFALGHIVFGWVLLRAGHLDEALVETGWALRMSPVDSFAGLYTTRSTVSRSWPRESSRRLFPTFAPPSRPPSMSASTTSSSAAAGISG
jgi:tetratricopeptide (TPR) repeat protein